MAPRTAQETSDRRNGFFQRMFSSLHTGRETWKTFPGDGSGKRGPNDEDPTPENYTMMQGFEWYVPDDKQHWARLTKALPGLRATGIDNIWIPPACKASSPSGNGYDIYDLYDLGEFDCKGSVGTKWGDKKGLQDLCWKANEVGVGIYFDAVLNHKAAADKTEKFRAQPVQEENRLEHAGPEREIEGWVGFEFPERGGKYSQQKYHWYHFTGTDYDNATGDKGVFRILGDGKDFAKDVDSEKGNFDYLMFADLDYSHKEVQDDVKAWGPWVGKELGLKGFRFDAIKHYSESFLLDFVNHLDQNVGQGWFMVGEFWDLGIDGLTEYLEKMQHKFSLFDAPLVGNFHKISTGDKADMRSVFDETLVQCEPYNAVTLVQNHDTQPSQALQLQISDWFFPHAYSLILLRSDGYPCLFYGDLYGIKGGVENDWKPPAAQGKIPDLTLARKLYAYGEQNDYFDAPNCVGWVRRGTWDRPAGMVVLMSNAEVGEKRMFVGKMHAGEKWTDILGWEEGEVIIDEEGWGVFKVGSCSVSVWVREDAQGRDLFGKFDAKIYEDVG